MDPHKHQFRTEQQQEFENPHHYKPPQIKTEAELKIINKMFDECMNKEWEKVLNTYSTHGFVRRAKLTKSEDTALHLAINCYHPKHRSKDHLQCIKKMVTKIPDDEVLDILKLKNDTGDTPLHLAAQLGNVEICRCILTQVEKLGKVYELIGERNNLNMTPLFLAAHRGKVDAFKLLHEKIKETEDRIHLCRKEKGETILHSTLSGEYFELAYEIIEKFPELVNYVSEDGTSPLHILARKPHVFKSSSYLGSYESIIYYCTEVTTSHKKALTEDDANDHFSFPENWRTFADFYQLIWNFMKWVFALKKIVKGPTAKQNNDPENQDSQPQVSGNTKNNTGTEEDDQRPVGAFPRIYYTDIGFLKFVMKLMLIILGIDANKHKETPILAAAKMGIQEIVEKIIKRFPISIHDVDPNQKNVLLLAVENRQVAVYNFLRKQKLPEFVYYQVDNKGNSAAHLAAMYTGLKYWRIPGDALQLQGEVKWYKYVKSHLPRESYVRYNNEGQAPGDVFLETHANLTKLGTTWLIKTSESCSVIAALIATVAFAASTTVPGGLDQNSGYPILEGQPAFSVFAVSSLIALCFSVTALVFFLAILTSRCQQKDFKNNLPIKLLLGLTSLFTSIAAILISFCAAHSFVIKSKLKLAAFPIYGVVCLPVTFFAFNQLPLYLDLFRSIVQPVHFRSYRVSYTGKPAKGNKLSSTSKDQ
ncbi:ankyrin repeat-containing protein ITN1-like isoform X4 [Ipomoea triloba]|uniref:ankyrin repeat-containing protein ITN1-like isoform X4 n=1 Tax=Ipomoea triloba TaxID=35885 RepID=UPI00125DA08F|nr:ankyrin repeat-containing protein ITN1-like isoform X4 [Ipomoea triloba]